MKNSPLKFVTIMKKYGPGFVAISEKTGKVLASGHDIQKMYSDAENNGVDFSKVIISHVPKYGSLSLYGVSNLNCY